jgi:hypothetical protein
MTTAHSPLRVLRNQADRMAMMLKAAERGEHIPGDNGKLAAARAKDSVKFVVAMDDKWISIDMPWSTIRETSECGISEYILNQMREARDSVN